MPNLYTPAGSGNNTAEVGDVTGQYAVTQRIDHDCNYISTLSANYPYYYNQTGSNTIVTSQITGGQLSYVNDLTWTSWTATSAGVTHQWRSAQRHELTPAQQALAAAEAADRRAASLAAFTLQESKWAAAKGRAEKLLMEHLSPEQQEELKDKGRFTVVVQDRKTSERRYYQIHRGRAGNVLRVSEQGVFIARLCAHPKENVPDADTMLAQKLWLEHMEVAFLALANKTMPTGQVIGGSRDQASAIEVVDDPARVERVLRLVA